MPSRSGNQAAGDLPLRQKQVLWGLCSGDREKQIAAKMSLMQQTLHD